MVNVNEYSYGFVSGIAGTIDNVKEWMELSGKEDDIDVKDLLDFMNSAADVFCIVKFGKTMEQFLHEVDESVEK